MAYAIENKGPSAPGYSPVMEEGDGGSSCATSFDCSFPVRAAFAASRLPENSRLANRHAGRVGPGWAWYRWSPQPRCVNRRCRGGAFCRHLDFLVRRRRRQRPPEGSPAYAGNARGHDPLLKPAVHAARKEPALSVKIRETRLPKAMAGISTKRAASRARP